MSSDGWVARGLHLLLAASLGVSVVGFVVGLRPVERIDREEDRGAARAAASEEAMPATPWWSLGDRKAGPWRQVTSDLSVLRATLPAEADPVPPFDPTSRSTAVALRAQRRAYDGAPPWIPHPVDEQSAAACLACHGPGMRVADRTAPVMSHEPRSQCLQCHVSTAAKRPGAEDPKVVNTFTGLPSAGRGARAWEGAPPLVPHRVFMRENCRSCHGVAGLAGLRTTHPARQNCTQCHVPAESPLPFARES